jgi:excinuclease ABC subunit C
MRIRDYEKRFLTENADVKADKVSGPFSSGTSLKEAVKLIRKIFPFRDKCEAQCGKPCFNAQIGLCPGVCTGFVTKEEYRINIRNIKNFFEGKTSEIKRDLKKQMDKYSEDLEFEKAARVRNTLFALDHIRDVSLIEKDETLEWKDANYRIEAFDVAHISGTSRVGVMTVVVNGKKEKSEYKRFKLIENVNDDYAGIVEMLKRRLRHDEWGRPDLVVIDGGIGQKNIAEKVIASLNKNIKVVSVVKDDKHKAREILGLDELNLSKERHEALSKAIILANLEAHRFALSYHVNRRDRIK